MRIMLSDGTEVNCDCVAEDTRVMVQAALEKKKAKHEEQVNKFVDAVFISSIENAIEECARYYALQAVHQFFKTKTGKAVINEATVIDFKVIAKRSIAEILEGN